MSEWKDYVLDVSMSEPCFCPMAEDGRVITGLMLVYDECPGNLVGVFHQEGQRAAEAWCAANPDWRETYSKKG